MMQGERRHPMAGLIGLWVGGLVLVFTLVNVHFAPWPGHMGQKFHGLPFILELFSSSSSQPIWGVKNEYSMQEWALLSISAIAFIVAWWGHRFRPEMSVPDAQNEASMREAMEAQEISVSAGSGDINPTTASIVAGIVGGLANQSQEEVSGAIGALSKGEFGEQAAQIAKENPKVEGPIEIASEDTDSIPLPDGDHAQTSSGGFNQVPLPEPDESGIDELIMDEEESSEPEVVKRQDMAVFSSGTRPDVAPDLIIDQPIELPPEPSEPPALPDLDDFDEPPEEEEEEELPELPSLPNLPGLPSLPSLDD